MAYFYLFGSFFLAQSCIGQYLTGKPSIFITSNDTEPDYESYELIYDGSRFFKLSEYVLIGIDDVSRFFIEYIDQRGIIDLSVAYTVEGVRNETISQNLMKELLFTHYNASGIFPQMIISNATITLILTSKAMEDKNRPGISYVVEYHKTYETLEMAPPYDLLVEVPGYSNYITVRKTLIDIQSFTFLRFQMTADQLVTYPQIVDHAEALFPSTLANGSLTWTMWESSIKMVHNPCIQDFFLLCMMVGKNAESTLEEGPSPVYTYVQIPAYFTEGNDGCWNNITSIYCPNPDYEEECGEPEDLILTNRHFLVLSSKGLFVSNDLTQSKFKLSDRYNSAPLARYDIVDPCKDVTDCFQTLSNPTEENLVYKRELKYTPFCDTQQYPNTDDMVIFVLEHTDQASYRNRRKGFNGTGPVKTYTITFAARPYTRWRPLFIKQEFFEDRYIEEINGIFYNPHFFRFDITMKLSPPVDTSKDTHGKYVRFVLPLPTEEPYMSQGYPFLNGTWGTQQGFIVQNFSETFLITGIAVNPGNLDVMIYGSEIHIAESGRPIVYQAVGGFVDPLNTVTGCHFNHPDRFYVCMLSKKTSILIGRVATGYGPVEVDLKGLKQIQRLIDVIFAVDRKIRQDEPTHRLTRAQEEVLKYIFDRSIFTASFSGQIYMWYFSNPQYFYAKMKEHDKECEQIDCYHNPDPPMERKELRPLKDYACSYETCYLLPCILPLHLDPLDFRVKNTPTNGPLVPYYITHESMLVYEGFVPGLSDDMVRYLTPVFIGQKIYCPGPEGRRNKYICDFYVRHIKLLTTSGEESLLPGFRSAIYGTIVDAFPMQALEDNLKIQMQENSNRVRVMCTSDNFLTLVACKDITFEDLGATLYIPGEFSILIMGEDWQIENSFKGIATHKTVLPMQLQIQKYNGFKMSLKTEVFTKSVIKFRDDSPNLDPNGTYGCNTNPPTTCKTTPKAPKEPTHKNDWEIGDGGCHFEMSLIPNSYVKSSGGKIDMDLQDSVSLQVDLQPLTSLGKIMMYRPLLVISQSNPEVLRISSKFSRKFDRQTLQVLLKPTGVKQGVSSFVIRSQVSSISCSSQSSFTFIVQCVRTKGRRLIISYPKTVDESEILAEGKPVVVDNQEIYKVLPTNYRPPSTRGVSVPLTTNVYNADPSKPMYQSWYKISKEKAEFKKCFMQSSREFCGCTTSDKLSDDPRFSDCKEKVYVATREEDLNISISYPPRLQDREQLQEYFSHTPRISVFIKEINGREDYSIRSKTFIQSLILNAGSVDELHEEINKDPAVSMGENFYSGEPLTIKLHGTGLYHFKAELGRFHSFNEVTGHFILYSDTNDLDDVMLIMIVILTMTVCFVLVFFGFMRLRHRLVSHLPIRVEPLKTKTA